MLMWAVEVTDEFADWYSALDEKEQDEVIARVDLLMPMARDWGVHWSTRSTNLVTHT